MNLATIRAAGTTNAALVEDEVARLLPFADVGDLLRSGASHAEIESMGGEEVPFESADLAPVVLAPRSIVCVGLNFRSHILEMGRELPTYPTCFSKHPGTLVGPRDDIVLAPAATRWDYEAELAVVIGHTTKDVSTVRAADAIAGYSVLNDITARDWQNHGTQWMPGKNFDHTAPLGPTMRLAADIADLDELAISCRVNERGMQRGTYDDLVFKPADVIAYVSTFMTLMPGDVIAMGTPGGVAAATDGPWLEPGDVVETTVDGLGTCTNTCVAPRS